MYTQGYNTVIYGTDKFVFLHLRFFNKNCRQNTKNLIILQTLFEIH